LRLQQLLGLTAMPDGWLTQVMVTFDGGAGRGNLLR